MKYNWNIIIIIVNDRSGLWDYVVVLGVEMFEVDYVRLCRFMVFLFFLKF